MSKGDNAFFILSSSLTFYNISDWTMLFANATKCKFTDLCQSACVWESEKVRDRPTDTHIYPQINKERLCEFYQRTCMRVFGK